MNPYQVLLAAVAPGHHAAAVVVAVVGVAVVFLLDELVEEEVLDALEADGAERGQPEQQFSESVKGNFNGYTVELDQYYKFECHA